MKYGLRSDKHSSKSKWKISMENDIACLKSEVSTLKHQLRSSFDIINTLLFKHSAEPSVKECRHCDSSVNKAERNASENNDPSSIGFTLKFPVDTAARLHIPGKTTAEPFFSLSPDITTRYKATLSTGPWDQQLFIPLKQLTCITAMPEYKDWSLEELRLAFHKATYENKLFCNFGLNDVLTGTKFVKYSPCWDYDPIVRKSTCIHCITANPTFHGRSLEELRLEDYILKGINISNKSVPAEGTAFQKSSNNISHNNLTNPQAQEDIFSKIMSQFEKMDTKLTSVSGQLSSVDASLSEMKSQISMMDSRLSAVDMFVTMQRMDKKWQELTSSLNALENVPKSDECPSEKQTKIVPPYSFQKLNFLNQELNHHNTSQIGLIKQSSVNSNTEIKTKETENEIEKLCDISSQNIIFIASKDTIIISYLPKKSYDYLLKESVVQAENPVSAVVDLNDTPQEGKNLSSDTPIADKPENPKLCDTLSPNNIKTNVECEDSGTTLSIKSKLEHSTVLKDSTLHPEYDSKNTSSDTPVADKPGNPKLLDTLLSNNSKTNVEGEGSGTTLSIKSKSEHSTVLKGSTLQPESDSEECEYVFVDKSDIDYDICDQSSNEVNDSTCSNNNADYKMCNNITEYLEVNMGKRKDLVYEFGFEAKPDCVIDSVLECSTSYGSPNEDASKTSQIDDSFLSYINKVVESKLVNQQQSTPVSTSKYTFYNNSKLRVRRASLSKDAGEP